MWGQFQTLLQYNNLNLGRFEKQDMISRGTIWLIKGLRPHPSPPTFSNLVPYKTVDLDFADLNIGLKGC